MSNTTHEIVTLQLGHYSNFVGTHWWNTQEASFVYDPGQAADQKEINHDVMYREGRNLMGDVTFTPRLVLLDLKGSLNTLKQDGHLYDISDVEDDVSWGYDVTMHKESTVKKNDFLKDLERQETWGSGEKTSPESEKEDSEVDLDASEEHTETTQVFGTKLYDLNKSVNVWSDYLKIHLHPRTIHLVQKYQHADDLEPFDMFGTGQAVHRDRRFNTELEDRIHFFIEECDHLQGLQIITDTHNAFGGLTSSLIQELEDELANKSLMVFGVSPPNFGDTMPMQDAYRVMNTALTFEKITNHSSAFIPLSLASSLGRKPGPPVTMPYLDYQADMAYHTSAMLAASLDTATLPFRLERPPSLLPHLTQAMTPCNRKILSLYSSLPFPLEQDSTVVNSLLNLGDVLPWQPMTPGCDSNISCTAQSLVSRGLRSGRLKGAPDPNRPRVLDRCETLDELMSIYLQEMCGCSLNAICSVRQPCKTTAPFPHIFSPKIDQYGSISTQDRPWDTGVEQIPMMTSLQATSAVRKPLDQILTDVKKIDFRKYHRVQECGMEEDEYREAIDNLATIVDNYENNGGDMV